MNRQQKILLFAFLVLMARPEIQSKEPASIDIISWLAGSWKGEAFGGDVEEIWSQPIGGTMIGMFRMSSKGKVQFMEFEEIVEQDGSLVFKVKHFTQAFIGWEEKEKSIEFPLVSTADNEAHFDGLRIIKIDDKTCKHVVTLKDKATGQIKDVEIVYHRTQLH
jgi:Domain of unknown function (DUF6265)